MNRETSSYQIPPRGNLLFIESDGRISSRRVSQIYGRALLGALTLRMNSLPFKILHESFLPQHEPWTLDKIRDAAHANAPRDNFMFINDDRKILSCRVHLHYGIALLESLPKAAEAVPSNPLSRLRTRETGESQEAITVPDEHAYEELHQTYEDGSSSSALRTPGAPASRMAILPDHILSSANRQAYDRDWMDRYNVNEDCLNGYPSKHKLDVLLRYGALRVGDRLCVAYHPDSGLVDKFGEVLQSPKTGCLDLRIAPPGANFDGILHDCKSPKDIITGMDREFQLERNSKISEAWKIVNVVAGDGHELGSLWKVRQAYQVFTEEMAEWGSRNRWNSP